MNPDADFLARQNRNLEAEIRTLKMALHDHYAGHALAGLIARGWSPDDLVVERAFHLATLAVEARGK